MILFDELPAEESALVKQICFIQLNSLRRIYNNQHHSDQEIIDILIDNEVSEDEFKDIIQDKLDKFKALHKKPNNLSNLNETELSTFKHILSQIEDMFKDKYPQAIANLWTRLFIIGDVRTIENLN